MGLIDTSANSEESFEDRFRQQMQSLTSSFDKGIMQKNTDLILNNMKMIGNLIAQYDVNELIQKNVNIFAMAMSAQKSRRLIIAAKNLNKYIYWDNKIIYDLTVDVLFNRHRIIFGPIGASWLRRNIERFGAYLMSQ